MVLPAFALLDNFNRANANTFGTNWSQSNNALRINSNVAFGNSAGQAVWNVGGGVFPAKQGAQLTFANNTLNNTALILKATGGTNLALPTNFIQVQYQTGGGGRVVVSTTINSGATFITRATQPASFVNGNKLGAVVDPTGLVLVYKTVGTTVTLVGTVSIPTTGTGSFPGATGTGRIGIRLPNDGRVDNFSGGIIP
jgi:hypothetical protein